jgi:hypothetical protein
MGQPKAVIKQMCQMYQWSFLKMPETFVWSNSAGLDSSLYSIGVALTENTVFYQFLCYSDVFTSPLHRNGSSSIAACVFISARTRLPSLCLSALALLFRFSGVMSHYYLPIYD